MKTRDDVLACSATATRIGWRTTGDLSTATEVASERLYCARDAPPFWCRRRRTAPDPVLRCRIWRGRRGDGGWRSRRWRFKGPWLVVSFPLLLLPLRRGIDGRCHLWE